MFFIKMFKVILISLLAFFLLLSCSKDEKIVYEPTQEDIASSTYKEAVEIADSHYELTGEIVAVERSEHHGNYVYNSP